MNSNWEKIGCILKPNDTVFWMKTFAGPSFALPVEDGIFDLYVTGRDEKNRSQIGIVKFNIDELMVTNISPLPVFSLGSKGSFDENGTAYPYVVKNEKKTFLYYTGWIPGILVPFMNDMGLAISDDGVNFKRFSRSPILNRTDDDYLGVGSMSVIKEHNFWHMYYTCFDRWGKDNYDHKHYYNIKYACSNDGINWLRFNHICIDFKDETEYSIGKPSVLKIGDFYHMWYSYRGAFYRIGHAISLDGRNWKRLDADFSLDISSVGWDSEMVCYSHVFIYKDYLYMLYNGNTYGKSGLGLARMNINKITENINLCNYQT